MPRRYNKGIESSFKSEKSFYYMSSFAVAFPYLFMFSVDALVGLNFGALLHPDHALIAGFWIWRSVGPK